MPESRLERNLGSVSISGDGLSVSISPYDANTQSEDFQAVGAGTYNVTAGAYKVEVFNVGLENITVNGDTIPTGEWAKFDAYANPATQRMDFCPAVTVIVPADGQATIKTISPST